jgi:arsenate reductase-like glutaredoxin family protein
VSVTIYHNPDCGTSRNVLALMLNRSAARSPKKMAKRSLTRAATVS